MFLRIGWVGWELTNLGWATCWLLYCTVNAIFSLILSAITVLAQFMTRVMQAEAKQHKRFPPRFSKIRLKYSSEKLWLNVYSIEEKTAEKGSQLASSVTVFTILPNRHNELVYATLLNWPTPYGLQYCYVFPIVALAECYIFIRQRSAN